MVNFGLPEMADAQAQSLVKQRTPEGLPWAVAAYMSAKRQETDNSLNQIAVAATAAPDEPFVVCTAAQVLAWYDLNVDKTKISADAATAAQTTRILLGGKADFKTAYTKATDAYSLAAKEPQAAAPATQVAANPVTPAPANPGYYGPAYGPVDAGYAAYPDPYYYTPIDYGYPSYASPWWPCGFGGPVWWPNFGEVIFIDNGRFHRHHDRDHDGDGGFGDRRGSFAGATGFAPTRSRDGWTWSRPADTRVTALTAASTNTSPFTPVRTGAGATNFNLRPAAVDPVRSTFNWDTVHPTVLPARTSTFEPARAMSPVQPTITPRVEMPVFRGEEPVVHSFSVPRSSFDMPVSAPHFSAPVMNNPAPHFSAPAFSSPPPSSSPPSFSGGSNSSGGGAHFSSGGGGGWSGGGGGHSGGGRR